jgi:hypothetical protein
LKTLILALITMMSLSAFATDSAWNGVIPAPTMTTPPPPHYPGYFYDWGQGRDGWGYCYQWTSSGQVLNQGMPVDNWNCEQSRPSMFNWGQAHSGWGYCYHYTPYGVPMDAGQPAPNYQCEQRAPSHYAWGQAQNGYTFCYQWTPYGVAMNDGQPVPNYYCGQ